jgi:hypothetical protein
VFHSEVDIPSEGLSSAILSVIEQASQSKQGTSTSFSLIIQEYIEADLSGVIFTRDPFGGRQIVIEYAEGACHTIVSGQVQPRRLEYFHTWRGTTDRTFDCWKLLAFAKTIEAHFNWPQDIEWCWSRGRLWILQARAITTLSSSQYSAMIYLDTYFTGSNPQLLQKSGVTEAAAAPMPVNHESLGATVWF